MRFFSKKTQTLIVSLISVILLFITPNLTRSQEVFATYDPLSVPNNKFGIHIIQATPDESSPAASLVNTNGDWGYITVLIEQKDKKKDKWQEFFNDLRRRHLIPIVRIASEPERGYWKIPNPDDVQSWADFLDSLVWPTKNRYVTIFNEPNHAQEWGGTIDPRSYALMLDKFITILKTKNPDFFVLNAGFDASAPGKLPNYQDQLVFMQQMNEAVPGIFEKLDGWTSHSYPNPAFAGSPDGNGRGTVRTFEWELQQLRNMGVSKNLPVFITETGWDNTNVDLETIAKNYQYVFNNAWNDPKIVAVTPFLLTYDDPLFDQFSFKIPHTKEYHPQFNQIKNMSKVSGKPIQINSANLKKGEVFSSIVSGEIYTIFLTFKNTGQSIWGDGPKITLQALEGGKELGIETVEVQNTKVEPEKDYTFQIKLKAPQKGNFKVNLQLFSDGKAFDSAPMEFTTEVKEPVILKILTKLKWKESAAGEYILRVSGAVGESTQAVTIDENGNSQPFEARYLLPDYSFDFTLEKENYKSETITQQVKAGENILDFGELDPRLLVNLINPQIFWQLLPFSN